MPVALHRYEPSPDDEKGACPRVLIISHLQKTYGQSPVPALADLSLRSAKGEFTSLLGPSGCGKTTALRIVGGLLEQTAGEVWIDGAPSAGPSRDKAMVFQQFNLLPWRTAEQNVAYGLEVRGVARRERLQVAREYIELVGMSNRAHHYPSQLSGGQNQRLGLARALAVQPKLLLMDEPFGALDALTREHLQGLLQGIAVERSLTVLFVTHSIDEAIFLSDKIVLMTTLGRVVEEFAVDLPKPRSIDSYRDTRTYSDLRKRIWSMLHEEDNMARGTALQRL